MADVTLSYKGSDILELSDSGSATLKTGGNYCEDDIEVAYTKPSGGDSPITKDTWTLASDYNTNTQTFYYGAYVDRTFNGLQVFYFSNNDASSNTATTAYIFTEAGSYVATRTVCGRIAAASHTYVTWSGSVSSGVSFNMTAGTVITRYKITMN